MRYRPIGPAGAIISVLSLSLAGDPARSRPTDWIPLLYAALENGISGFDVREPDRALMEGIGQALAGVDRRLAFVAWRLGEKSAGHGGGRDFSARALMDQVRTALTQTGLQYLDAVLLDEPPVEEPLTEGLGALEQLKAAGLVRFVGLAGEGEAIDAQVSGGGFDLLSTPYNLTSGWRERHRLRAASASDTAVIGYRFCPSELRAGANRPAKPTARPGRGWDDPLAGCGTYAFLENTPGWKADEICLAYALTEPCLASVQVRPSSLVELERLAAVVERDMPPGLAAQIEMARFSPQPEAPAQVHAKRSA